MKRILLIGIMGTWMMFKYGSLLTNLFSPAKPEMNKAVVLSVPAKADVTKCTYFISECQSGTSDKLSGECEYPFCVKKLNDTSLETEKKQGVNESFLWNLVLL